MAVRVTKMWDRGIVGVLAAGVVLVLSGCLAINTPEGRASDLMSLDAREARDAVVGALGVWESSGAFAISNFYKLDVRGTWDQTDGGSHPNHGVYDVQTEGDEAVVWFVFGATVEGSGFVNQQQSFATCIAMTGERGSKAVDISTAECPEGLLRRLGWGGSRVLDASSLHLPD